jgi:hypothetical protein
MVDNLVILGFILKLDSSFFFLFVQGWPKCESLFAPLSSLFVNRVVKQLFGEDQVCELPRLLSLTQSK